MAKSSLEELIKLHNEMRDEASPKELAELEWEINFARMKAGERGMFRDWAITRLGMRPGTTAVRARLLTFGSAMDALWALLAEGKVTYDTANGIAAVANAYARKYSIELKEAVGHVLGNMTKAKHGSGYSFRNPPPPPGAVEEEPTPEPPPSTSSNLGTLSKLTKKRLERECRNFVEVQMGPEALTIDAVLIADELVGMMGVALDDARAKIEALKTKKRAEENVKVGRRKFAEACKVMSLNLKWSQPFDLTEVKHRKNKRVLELHPDRNEGDHQFQKELEKVLQAYETIETHHREVHAKQRASHRSRR